MTLQHISEVLPRALRPRHDPETLFDLAEQFEAAEALDNPDVTVALDTLRMTAEGTIVVPDMGCFAFTDWSRKQCSSLVGLRWDRWFENTSPALRAEEMTHRFERASSQVKLRTSRTTAEGSPACDGTLRAFVSPGYTPISDSMLAGMLAIALGGFDPELRLVRADVTDRSVSYVIKVGEADRTSALVGELWGGLLVRNSGVGFASLLVSLHLTRLVCDNGMTAPLPDAVLVRRRHRGVDEDRLRELLARQLERLPDRLAQGAAVLRAGRDHRVGDVVGEIRSVLRSARLPQRLVPQVLGAFDAEPEYTAFGLVQALTSAAQHLSPELRFELEQAAGQYLAQAASTSTN